MMVNTSPTGLQGKSFKDPIVVGIVIAVILICFFTFLKVFSIFAPQTVTTTEVQNVILGGLREMSELTITDLSGKATVRKTQEQKLGPIYLGDTNVIYEGVGRIQAGIDMKELKVKEVNPQKHQIHLVLPAPRIVQTFLDVDNSQVIDRYRRWLGPDAEANLQTQAQKEALKRIRHEACSSHILDKASNDAQALIKQFLTTAGYKDIQIEVKSVPAGTCPTA